MERTSTQSGSVFFVILLAIAMFAGLSYAVMKNSRGSQAGLTTEQSKLAALEIIEKADAVAKTVQTLRLRGCTENQIDFDTPVVGHTNFNNPQAPSDKSCDVYRMEGGKLNYYTPPQTYHDTVNFTHQPGYASDANASFDIAGTPTKATDLTLYVYELKKDICVAINKIQSIDTESNGDVSTETYDSWWKYFDGTYRTGVNSIGDGAGVKHANRTMACFKDSGSSYTFYRVLIAR